MGLWRGAWAPVAAVLGSVVSLTAGASFAKAVFAEVGAPGMTAYRVGFAAFLLLAVSRPWRWPLAAEQARAIAAWGVVLGVMNLCFYMAIATVPLGLAIAIEFLGPLAVAIGTSRRARDFTWIALAGAGLALLLPLGGALERLDPTGVAWALAAAVCWALYVLWGKRAAGGPAGQATALGLAVAALVVCPIGIWHAGAALLDVRLAGIGLVVAVLSSAIPYSLEMYALRLVPPATFGILLSMEPAVGAASGWLILGEGLAPRQLLAIACVTLASVGVTLTAPRRPAPGAGAVEA